MSCIFPCRHCGRLGIGDGIPQYISEKDKTAYPDSLFVVDTDHIHVPTIFARCVVCQSPLVIFLQGTGPALTERPHLARLGPFTVTCVLDESHRWCQGTEQEQAQLHSYITGWLRRQDIIMYKPEVGFLDVPKNRRTPDSGSGRIH
jgi:hypothetical protein